MVIVHKPSGLAAHRGWAADPQGYALQRVRDQLGGDHVYLGHRLDRATSGALALARRAELQGPLQAAFATRAAHKRYLVAVRGVPARAFAVDYPVPKTSRRDPERVPARTRFRRLAVFERRYCLLEAIPATGRLHQIRRHLSHVRHPVLGDTTYGDGRVNRDVRDRFGLHRLALHAYRLSLPHPETGQRVAVRAVPCQDLAEPLERMGLWPTWEPT